MPRSNKMDANYNSKYSGKNWNESQRDLNWQNQEQYRESNSPSVSPSPTRRSEVKKAVRDRFGNGSREMNEEVDPEAQKLIPPVQGSPSSKNRFTVFVNDFNCLSTTSDHSLAERNISGLKNNGATCWFNSFIHLLYQLGEFRRIIYNLDPSEELLQEFKVAQLVVLMKTFFEAMQEEPRKRVLNPKRLSDMVHRLNSIVTDRESFGQQDSMEMMLKVIEWSESGLEKYVKAAEISAKVASEDFSFAKIFHGNHLDVHDNSSHQVKNSLLIYHLNVEHGDFYSAMEDNQYQKALNKEIWCESPLPSVLFINPTRAQFIDGHFVVLDNEFHCDDVIYMDRFLYDNKPTVDRLRKRKEDKLARIEELKCRLKTDYIIRAPELSNWIGIARYVVESQDEENNSPEEGSKKSFAKGEENSELDGCDEERPRDSSEDSEDRDEAKEFETPGPQKSDLNCLHPSNDITGRSSPICSETKESERKRFTKIYQQDFVNSHSSPPTTGSDEVKTKTRRGKGQHGIENHISNGSRKRKLQPEWSVAAKKLLLSVNETKALQDKISKLEKEVKQIYEIDDLKKVPYRLHYVIIHSGSPQSGHYWACLKDKESDDTWIELDDIQVREISKQQMLQQAIGGPGSFSSAHCYVYVRAKDVDWIFTEPEIPPKKRQGDEKSEEVKAIPFDEEVAAKDNQPKSSENMSDKLTVNQEEIIDAKSETIAAMTKPETTESEMLENLEQGKENYKITEGNVHISTQSGIADESPQRTTVAKPEAEESSNSQTGREPFDNFEQLTDRRTIDNKLVEDIKHGLNQEQWSERAETRSSSLSEAEIPTTCENKSELVDPFGQMKIHDERTDNDFGRESASREKVDPIDYGNQMDNNQSSQNQSGISDSDHEPSDGNELSKQEVNTLENRIKDQFNIEESMERKNEMESVVSHHQTPPKHVNRYSNDVDLKSDLPLNKQSSFDNRKDKDNDDKDDDDSDDFVKINKDPRFNTSARDLMDLESGDKKFDQDDDSRVTSFACSQVQPGNVVEWNSVQNAEKSLELLNEFFNRECRLPETFPIENQEIDDSIVREQRHFYNTVFLKVWHSRCLKLIEQLNKSSMPQGYNLNDLLIQGCRNCIYDESSFLTQTDPNPIHNVPKNPIDWWNHLELARNNTIISISLLQIMMGNTKSKEVKEWASEELLKLEDKESPKEIQELWQKYLLLKSFWTQLQKCVETLTSSFNDPEQDSFSLYRNTVEATRYLSSSLSIYDRLITSLNRKTQIDEQIFERTISLNSLKSITQICVLLFSRQTCYTLKHYVSGEGSVESFDRDVFFPALWKLHRWRETDSATLSNQILEIVRAMWQNLSNVTSCESGKEGKITDVQKIAQMVISFLNSPTEWSFVANEETIDTFVKMELDEEMWNIAVSDIFDQVKQGLANDLNLPESNRTTN